MKTRERSTAVLRYEMDMLAQSIAAIEHSNSVTLASVALAVGKGERPEVLVIMLELLQEMADRRRDSPFSHGIETLPSHLMRCDPTAAEATAYLLRRQMHAMAIERFVAGVDALLDSMQAKQVLRTGGVAAHATNSP